MARIPLVATYRLQLTPSFGLDAAAALVPYLAELGISHVYTSSYLQAAEGSTHGYDTVDHARVSDELGGEAALERFHAALREHGLGNVVDVVPNHVSVADAATNRRWWNVLRDGPTSTDARFFDIDWDPPESKLQGIVLVPVLGDDYAAELASGAIRLVTPDGAGSSDEHEIHYGPLRFPVSPGTVTDVAAARAGGDALHEVLERQHYRLACWRVARDELNYRRFFDVTTLAGVRVEDPEVFAAVHARTLGWVASGDVQGLRIDHPDGLRDPAGYLVDLRTAAPDAWIVIEKILEPGEHLPASWPIDGTTGYDIMRRITGVFIDPTAEAPLTATFAEFVGEQRPYAAQVLDAKQQALGELLGSEVTRLTDLAAQCCEASMVARDFSRREIRSVVEALLVSMPVYRTYSFGAPGGASEHDCEIVAAITADAKELVPSVSATLIDFLGSLLGGVAEDDPCREFVARFEQLSGPAMAKGVEDTVFYRFNRLIALNEVGADPGSFGVSIEEFHRESLETVAHHPSTMSSTSTHDTKRSEDVRARIALLSEMPTAWHDTVLRWRDMNASNWGDATPNRATEYLLYQTLVGAHPLTNERTHEFLLKSMREAKQVTSWLAPTPAEDEMLAFADAIAADPAFRAELDELVHGLDEPARIATSAQLVLKALGPGIPDFYQGSELRTTSLVDPDNRSEVDYDERRRLLAADTTSAAAGAGSRSADKLALTRRLLQLRARHAECFVGAAASYDPVAVSGDRAGDTIAFARGGGVVVAATVRPLRFAETGWGSTDIALPPGTWRNAVDDQDVRTYTGSMLLAGIAGAHGIAVLVEVGAR